MQFFQAMFCICSELLFFFFKFYDKIRQNHQLSHVLPVVPARPQFLPGVSSEQFSCKKKKRVAFRRIPRFSWDIFNFHRKLGHLLNVQALSTVSAVSVHKLISMLCDLAYLNIQDNIFYFSFSHCPFFPYLNRLWNYSFITEDFFLNLRKKVNC